jgi:hypothetical protein
VILLRIEWKRPLSMPQTYIINSADNQLPNVVIMDKIKINGLWNGFTKPVADLYA